MVFDTQDIDNIKMTTEKIFQDCLCDSLMPTLKIAGQRFIFCHVFASHTCSTLCSCQTDGPKMQV